MTRLSRFAAVVVLVGGSTAVLSSCSGDPGPILTETPSPTAVVSAPPSPSPTPTVTPEEELLAQIPEDARAENFVSASNFAKFFLGLYPGLFTEDADTQLFAQLSAPDCNFCSSALADSAETAEASAHSEGGELAWPGEVLRGGIQNDGFWYVTQDFEADDTVTYLSDGSEYQTSLGGHGEVGAKLKWDGGAWHVYGIEFVFDD